MDQNLILVLLIAAGAVIFILIGLKVCVPKDNTPEFKRRDDFMEKVEHFKI